MRNGALRSGRSKPGFTYTRFAVDGLRLPDPRNRRVKNGYPGISSILEIRGGDPARRQYGTVHVHSYDSQATRSRRRMHVYTPPGFRTADRGLPVLVLLHGSWDSDADWAAPMIIAMLDGHPLPTFDASTRQRNLELLEQEIVSDVIPMLEQKYSVSHNWQDRAIAGLSMGGAQALHIGFRRWYTEQPMIDWIPRVLSSVAGLLVASGALLFTSARGKIDQ